MIDTTLICHPAPPSNNHYALTVSVVPQIDGGLNLRYHLTGGLTRLRVPAPQLPTATDGLWQHTCFEAFVAVEGELGYHEFNFSPSGQWAAYAFSHTRERYVWLPPQMPTATFIQTSDAIVMEAHLPALVLPVNANRKPLQLALAAVLETLDSQLSYWALHHPSATPDFHDRAGFRITLPQPFHQPL